MKTSRLETLSKLERSGPTFCISPNWNTVSNKTNSVKVPMEEKWVAWTQGRHVASISSKWI